MNNFLFENKTKVYFGKGGVKEYLGCLLEHYGDTVMLAYGGGSIKHNGVYDEIVGILNAEGKRIVEFPGIMPNPTYAKVQEGAKLARENHVDLILAVGGGSVSDCCKVVSAQAKVDEDLWELENTKHSRRLQTVFSPANTIRLPSLKQARTTAASCRSSSQTALTRTAPCWNCYTVLPPRKMQHLPRSHWRGCCAKSLISYQSPAPGNLTVYRKTPVQRILCCLPQKWL